MPKQNLNSNLDQVKNLKSLATSIAHETRNPLVVIREACEGVKNNLDEAIRFLDLIATSSMRGLGIIDVVLASVREEEIDRSKFIYILISTTVEAACREYAFESDDQKALVNVDLKDDFDFLGDETLMIFVLFNLLRNSLHYQAKIKIWLDGEKRCLYFKSDGVWIDEEKLPFVFDDGFEMGMNKRSALQMPTCTKTCTKNLQNLTSTEQNPNSFGLGLPFCKKIMKAFGGDIFVESKEGNGVQFRLQFPDPMSF